VVDGKRAQVAALNDTGFSLEEYSWVRQQVYAAAGLALAQMDLRDIANAAQSGEREIPVEKTEAGDVPERNRELVKPYADKLREWLAFGFFGL
jgi:hypothetical protein